MSTKTKSMLVVLCSCLMIAAWMPHIGTTADVKTTEYVTIFEEDFEGSLSSAEGGNWVGLEWDFMSDLWHQSKIDSWSGSYSLAFNNEETGNYDEGRRVIGEVWSTYIDLQSVETAYVEFKHRWEHESYPGDYDKMLACLGNHKDWVQLGYWDSNDGPSSSGWTTCGPYDISQFIGSSVGLSFGFDSVDKWYNNYAGWFIDDVKIYGQLPSTELAPPFDTGTEISDAYFFPPTAQTFGYAKASAYANYDETNGEVETSVGGLAIGYASYWTKAYAEVRTWWDPPSDGHYSITFIISFRFNIDIDLPPIDFGTTDGVVSWKELRPSIYYDICDGYNVERTKIPILIPYASTPPPEETITKTFHNYYRADTTYSILFGLETKLQAVVSIGVSSYSYLAAEATVTVIATKL